MPAISSRGRGKRRPETAPGPGSTASIAGIGSGSSSSAAGEPGDLAWFDLHAREVAARLGLSHSHVRNVINRSEAEGLLVQDRSRGRVALTPRLLTESEAWFRSFWGWIVETAQRAQATEAPPPG